MASDGQTGTDLVDEPEVHHDAQDSGVDELSDSESTQSLESSILQYQEENGRRYHSYKAGQYVLPNDEPENDRLDLQHQMSLLTLDDKLYASPLGSNIQRVLDLGTGTGIWAIDFADAHPEAEVIGIDLSPIQPSFVPPNLHFEVDDIEEPWTYTYPFDFIHCRMLTGSVKDWPRLLKRAFRGLKPGGWLELHDIQFPIRCDDNTLGDKSALSEWSKSQVSAFQKMGRTITHADQYKTMMLEAGFQNVQEVIYKWPINGWPQDKKEKLLGRWECENFLNGLQAFTLATHHRILGWSQEEVEVFLVDVRKDIKNRNIHAYFPIYVVYGQKVATEESSEPS